MPNPWDTLPDATEGDNPWDSLPDSNSGEQSIGQMLVSSPDDFKGTIPKSTYEAANPVSAFLKGATAGSTYGFNDELLGGVDPEYSARIRAEKAKNPYSYFAGELLAPNPLQKVALAKRIAKVAPLAKKTIGEGVEGAMTAAATALGTGGDVSTSAILGAGLGATMSQAGKLKDAIASRLKKGAENWALKSVPGFDLLKYSTSAFGTKPTPEIKERVGRAAIDSGVAGQLLPSLEKKAAAAQTGLDLADQLRSSYLKPIMEREATEGFLGITPSETAQRLTSDLQEKFNTKDIMKDQFGNIIGSKTNPLLRGEQKQIDRMQEAIMGKSLQGREGIMPNSPISLSDSEILRKQFGANSANFVTNLGESSNAKALAKQGYGILAGQIDKQVKKNLPDSEFGNYLATRQNERDMLAIRKAIQRREADAGKVTLGMTPAELLTSGAGGGIAALVTGNPLALASAAAIPYARRVLPDHMVAAQEGLRKLIQNPKAQAFGDYLRQNQKAAYFAGQGNQ